MAMCVIAMFLCMMDDGSGHDYASDDEHLSLSTVLRLFNAILGALVGGGGGGGGRLGFEGR